MPWNCSACTYLNPVDGAKKCSICNLPRSEAEDVAAAVTTTQKRPATVQATLFGGIAAPAAPKNKNKRSTSASATAAPKNNMKSNAAVAVGPDAAVENNPKTKKRKKETTAAAPAAPTTSTQGTLSFFGKVSNKSTLHNIQPGTEAARECQSLACRECAARDTSLSELKKRAKAAMKHVFGIKKLRALQPQAISTALRRESQLVIMATGNGKSLCFQLPAVVLGGTTICVSPLLALMQDQRDALIKKGVEAAVISSSQTVKQNDEVVERLLGRSLKAASNSKKPETKKTFKHITILFVTPEQVQTNRFRDTLVELHKRNKLTLFAIDEAHCISSWGHDFRKAYMRLDYLRESFPDVPLLACTATATARVVQDIKKLLRLEDSPCLVGSFDRPNIFYKVKYKDSLDANTAGGAKDDMVRFIQKQHKRCAEKEVPCSGIIYVHKRNDTTEIAHLIRKECGIVAEAYHGGMKKDERSRVLEAWTAGIAQVAVATVAFGMGIDSATVRYVIHWSMSKSIEAFYQESGRAGRDGLPAYSLLYCDMSEPSKFRWLVNMQAKKAKEPKEPVNELAAIDEMEKYCMEPGCRRLRLLKHFGQQTENLKELCDASCDYCQNPTKVEQAIEAAGAAYNTMSTGMSNINFGEYENSFGTNRNIADDDEEDDYDSFDLRRNDPDGLQLTSAGASGGDFDDLPLDDEPDKKPTANFVKASAVLSKYSKYEAKECSGGTGFVNFREKFSAEAEGGEVRRDNQIRIPQHLIPATKQGPLVPKSSNKPAKTSRDYAAEANRLRAELAKAKEESEARRSLKQARAPPPPPPPTLSFKSKKK